MKLIRIFGIFIVSLFLLSCFAIFFERKFQVNVINTKYNSWKLTKQGALDYLGLYSFTDDLVGSSPVGWTTVEDSNTHCSVVGQKDGHSKVVDFYDNYGSGSADLYQTISPQTSGIIEFWYYGQQSGSENRMDFHLWNSTTFYAPNRGPNLLFQIDTEELEYHDGSSHKICDLSNDAWHHIRVEFDCSKSTFDIYVDGIKRGANFSFWYDISFVSVVFFKSGNSASGEFHFYLDAIDYSWAPGYYINRNLDYQGNSNHQSSPISFSGMLICLVSVFILVIIISFKRRISLRS